MLPTRFSHNRNVLLALLGEDSAVPDEFVQSLRACITNTDMCPPKAWHDAYDDLHELWVSY